MARGRICHDARDREGVHSWQTSFIQIDVAVIGRSLAATACASSDGRAFPLKYHTGITHRLSCGCDRVLRERINQRKKPGVEVLTGVEAHYLGTFGKSQGTFRHARKFADPRNTVEYR